MTISDYELVRWCELMVTVSAQPRPPVAIVLDAFSELRDARRKLAAVERLVSEAKFYEMNSQDAGYVYSSSGVDDLLDELRAALAAGGAPTEPATCIHGKTHEHELPTIGNKPARIRCLGPVPQGGTE